MTKKLSESSNTKKEFVAAYNAQLAEIEELKKALSNPQEVVAEKKKIQTLETAEKLISSNLPETAKNLQEQIGQLLGTLVEQVSTGSEELKSLNESIKIKKEELKDLFDIESKAYSLTALINAEKQTEIDHANNVDARRKELNEMLAELNGKINSAKDMLDEKLKEIDKQVLVAKEKAVAELEYDLERKKKVDNDSWEDEKKEREAKLAEKEKQLNERVKAVTEREQKVNELEEKVNSIPTLIAEAKQEAYEDGKAKAEKAKSYEVKAIKDQFTSEKKILENKIEMLEERLNAANAEITQSKQDLKDAYEKMNETAKATVEAGANKALLSKLESSLKDKNN